MGGFFLYLNTFGAINEFSGIIDAFFCLGWAAEHTCKFLVALLDAEVFDLSEGALFGGVLLNMEMVIGKGRYLG